MRVLIMSVTAGQGHHATAQAIAVPLREQGHTVEILDTFAYASPMLKEFVDKGYLLATRLVPEGYGMVYDRLNRNNKPSGKYSPGSLMSHMLMQDMERYVTTFAPDIIITVHCFSAAILNQMIRAGVTHALTVGVITDFTVHPYWQDAPDLDYYLVADRLLGFQLVRKNLDLKKMLPFGIPVHPKFYRYRSRTEAREALHLDPDRKTLMIISGSMGYGRLDEQIRLLDRMPNDFQSVVVCGNNQAMENKIRRMELHKPFRIYGYVNNVDEMMDAADCVVTKPGGLTVSEALAKRLPMILANPIPGHERLNAEFLLNNQLAMMATETYGLDEAVYTLLEQPGFLERLRGNCEIFQRDKGNSALRLVKFLTEKVKEREKS